MTYTVTRSQTTTYTDARARYVMGKVLDDLVMVAACGLITFEKAKAWADDLTSVILLQALSGFQLRFTWPDGRQAALGYVLRSDGSLSEDSASGGINYYALPKGTQATIVLDMNRAAPGCPAALELLRQRGWGMNGSLLQAAAVRDRAYSQDGFGLVRNKIGDWQ